MFFFFKELDVIDDKENFNEEISLQNDKRDDIALT